MLIINDNDFVVEVIIIEKKNEIGDDKNDNWSTNKIFDK